MNRSLFATNSRGCLHQLFDTCPAALFFHPISHSLVWCTAGSGNPPHDRLQSLDHSYSYEWILNQFLAKYSCYVSEQKNSPRKGNNLLKTFGKGSSLLFLISKRYFFGKPVNVDQPHYHKSVTQSISFDKKKLTLILSSFVSLAMFEEILWTPLKEILWTPLTEKLWTPLTEILWSSLKEILWIPLKEILWTTLTET